MFMYNVVFFLFHEGSPRIDGPEVKAPVDHVSDTRCLKTCVEQDVKNPYSPTHFLMYYFF